MESKPYIEGNRDEIGSGQGLLLCEKEGISNQDAGENGVPIRKAWSNVCK